MIGKWAIATTVTAATVFTALAAPAGAISLGSLISSNGTLDTADKIFSDFSCIIDNPTGTNRPFSCDELEVSILPKGSGNGLKFSGNISAAPGEDSYIDVLIGYIVTAKPGTDPFDIIGLAFTPQLSNPDSIATITETVKTLNDDLLATFTVFAPDDLSDPKYEDGQDLPLSKPVFQAEVKKDIYVSNGASISMFTQTYEEKVPEPAAVGGLVGLAALGIGSIYKRNRQNKA